MFLVSVLMLVSMAVAIASMVVVIVVSACERYFSGFEGSDS